MKRTELQRNAQIEFYSTGKKSQTPNFQPIRRRYGVANVNQRPMGAKMVNCCVFLGGGFFRIYDAV